MSVGNIVVELELNDGNFIFRTKRAGKEINSLSGNFSQLEKRVKGVERGIHGFIPTLRDIAIIGASARTVIHSLNDAFIGWTHGIIKSNAEIERLNMLMQGLSTASTLDGKIAQAAKEVDLLFEKAQRAPFAINELSNSFVKLKTSGIDDVMGNLNALTDAIANFGGDNQTLHRATIAIQQMASKGVVSMEELRQQLGESVPNAIKLMAVGMERTVGELVQAISTGTVMAKPAIEAMMLEFEKAMGGSSERMMATWNGMVSQLTTKWIMFQKEIGDTGYFDAAKGALEDLTKALDTEEAALFAKNLGEGLTSIVESARELVTVLVDNKDAIVGVTKAIGSFLLVTKGLSLFVKYFGKLNTIIVSFIEKIVALGSVTKVIPAIAGVTYATTALTTATTIGTRATGLFRLALAALGGPVGAIITGIGLASIAWSEYSDNAGRAEKSTLAAVKAGNRVELGKGPGVVTTSEVVDISKGVDELRKRLEERRKILSETAALLENAHVLEKKYGQSFVDGENYITNAVRGIREQRIADERVHIASLEDLLTTAETGLYEGMEKIVKAGAEKIKAARLKGMGQSVSLLSSQYKARLDVILENERIGLGHIEESGMSEVEIRKRTTDAVRKISEDRFNDEILLAQSEIRKIEKLREGFAAGSKEAIAIHIIDTQKSKLANDAAIEFLKIEKERLSQELDSFDDLKSDRAIEIKTKLLPDLDSQIASKTTAIKSFVNHASSMIKKLGIMMGVANTKKLLSDTRGGQLAIQALTDKVTELQKKLAAVSEEKPNFNMLDTKAAENNVKSLLSILNSASVKMEKLKSQNKDSASSGYLAQQIQKIQNVGRSAKDLIANYENLSNAEKKLQLTAMIKDIAIGVEQQQSIKDFTGKILDLEKATNLTRNAIRRIGGVDVQFDWIRDEEKKLESLNVEIEKVERSLIAASGKHSADSKWIKDTEGKLISLAAQAKVTADSIEKAKGAKQDKLDANKALILERSRLISIKDRAKMERNIAIASSKGTYDAAAAYAVEERAIRDAYAAKLMLRERVSNEGALSQVSKDSLALKENEIAAIHRADIRAASIDRIISHEQTLANIQFSMTRDSMNKDIAMLEEETNRRKIEAKRRIGDEREYENEVIRINKRHAKNLEAIQFNHRGPFREMLDDWVDTTDKMGAASAKFSNGFADQLANLVVDGKADFASLMKSFAKEMLSVEFKSTAGNLANLITGNGGPTGKPDGGGTMSPILDGAASALGIKNKGTGEALLSVTESIRTGWSDMSASVGKIVATDLPNLVSGVKDSFVENFGGLVTSMSGFLEDGLGGIVDYLGGLLSSVGGAISKLFSGNSGGGADAGSAVSSVGGSIISALFANGGTMGADLVDDKTMKKGGVATSAKMAIFGEASVPEAFVPMKDGKNVDVTITEMNGNSAKAVIPLPSGQMLSTKVSVASGAMKDDGALSKNIRAFAKGGAMGGSTGSMPSITNGATGDGFVVINNFSAGQDIVNILKDIRDGIETAQPAVPSMNGVDSYDERDERSVMSKSGAAKESGDVSITINVTNSGENTKTNANAGSVGERWNDVASRVKSIVKQEIAYQQRPGGSLHG